LIVHFKKYLIIEIYQGLQYLYLYKIKEQVDKTMQVQQLNFTDINPHVRYANLLQCLPGFIEGPRLIYDHQFVYVHTGKGFMEIDGTRYCALPGDLFYYGPGIIHAFYADENEPYVLTGIHFDYTKRYKDQQFPIGNFSLQLYDEKLITENIVFNDFNGFPPKSGIYKDSSIQGLLLELVNEFECGRIHNQEYIDGLMKVFLVQVIRCNLLASQFSSKYQIVEEAIKYIQDNYNVELTNDSIAARFHFNANYLNQLMLMHTGVTLRQYLINIRIKKAMDMLLHTNMSVTEISANVGYSDLHYFSRLFKKKTGFSPIKIKSKSI
jgi:Response regulator containing CheY-like receiver domain and AraC-type DNA-binding domain